MANKIIGIIPSRYASTRFPGKALVDIQGKSMVQRVYEQASKCALLEKIIVATDDERIFTHVKAFGGEVVMTSEHHVSGTDRCWEALQYYDSDFNYVINIQGDEPFIEPKQVEELAVILDGSVELATQMIPVISNELLFDKGEVKIVLNNRMEAMYFSRNVVPFFKGVAEQDWYKHHTYYRHVGMYAYRRDILEQITKLPVSSLEKSESLEQLRWLENGYKIKCCITQFESHCIDTPEDLHRILSQFVYK